MPSNPVPKITDGHVTIELAARLISCSTATIMKYAKNGRIASRRFMMRYKLVNLFSVLEFANVSREWAIERAAELQEVEIFKYLNEQRDERLSAPSHDVVLNNTSES